MFALRSSQLQDNEQLWSILPQVKQRTRRRGMKSKLLSAYHDGLITTVLRMHSDPDDAALFLAASNPVS